MNKPADILEASTDNTGEMRKKPGPVPGEGGRPPKPESERKTERVTTRFTKQERDQIEEAAEEKGISKNELIRAAVREYLEQ